MDLSKATFDFNQLSFDFSKATFRDFENIPGLDIFERAVVFRAFIDFMAANGHLNYKLETSTGCGPVMMIQTPYKPGPQRCICYVSNDYLNLSQHPEVMIAGAMGIFTYGTGTAASPLIGGHYRYHVELEQAIARFYGRANDESVIFTTGYTANTASLLSLLGSQDYALIDAGVHTSVREGLGLVASKTFRHNDLNDLERLLKLIGPNYRTVLIIVDGVYSQDGDMAPLDALHALARKYGAYLMVDDAHGVGVMGEHGRGALEVYDLMQKVDILTGTFSKTFGHLGGYVISTPEMANYLKFQSRQQIFSTTMPASIACGAAKAVEMVDAEPERRQRLWENVRYLKAGLESLGFDLGTSCSAIIPVKIGDPHLTGDLGRLLLEAGVYTNPILYPAVARKDARIRMSLMATHTRAHLDATLNAFADAARKMDLFRKIKQAKDNKKG